MTLPRETRRQKKIIKGKKEKGKQKNNRSEANVNQTGGEGGFAYRQIWINVYCLASVWVSEIRKEVKIKMEMDKGNNERGERGKVVVAVVVVVVVVVIVMMVEIVIVIVMTRE